MGVRPSEYAACAVADAALMTPVFQPLSYVTVARFSAEQGLLRANTVQDDAFARYVPSGERMVEVTLEALSDDSAAEQLLNAAVFSGGVCLIRLDTAQGDCVEGRFWVTRLHKEAAGERFERIRVELRSDGEVTLS